MRSSYLTKREEAKAIEQFGDDLLKSLNGFCAGFSLATVDRVCAIPNQEHLDCIGKAISDLGAAMSAECDEAEEADDRRRDNPLERDHRRLGQ
jgi:hypothetical protein